MMSSSEIAPAMGSERLKNAAPAVASTSRISSVAYATDDSASEANTARPTALPMAWCGISEVSSGWPRIRWRREAAIGLSTTTHDKRLLRQMQEGQ